MAISLTKWIKSLVISEENTTTPREVQITPGGTAGTKTTVTGTQTVDVTVSLPNATDTLVGRATADTLSNKTLDNSTIANLRDDRLTIQDNADVSKQLQINVSAITTGTTRTVSVPDANTTMVGTDTTQTLTNKSIDADTNTISNIDNGDIKVGAAIDAAKISNGTVSNTEFDFLDGVSSNIQTQLNNTASAGALAAHVGASFSVHGVTGSVVGTTDTQTLTNKTLDNSNIVNARDDRFAIQGSGDATKQVRFEVDGITTGTMRAITVPDVNDTMVTLDATQTVTNKLINENNTISARDDRFTIGDNLDTTKRIRFETSSVSTGTTRVLTAPNVDTTLAGTDATQTLTNKTIGDALSLTEISTPTTPASGFFKIYPKSDNSLYTLNDLGVESKLLSETTQTVFVYARGLAATTLSSGGNIARFATKVTDTHNAFTVGVSGGTFTAPTAGVYSITGSVLFTATFGSVADGYSAVIAVNGSNQHENRQRAWSTGSAASRTMAISGSISLAAGATVTLVCYCEGSAQALVNDNVGSYICITRIGS